MERIDGIKHTTKTDIDMSLVKSRLLGSNGNIISHHLPDLFTMAFAFLLNRHHALQCSIQNILRISEAQECSGRPLEERPAEKDPWCSLFLSALLFRSCAPC